MNAPDRTRAITATAHATAIAPLIASLKTTFGASLRGIFLYGSCLRSRDYHSGLVDLYCIVDDYRSAYARRSSLDRARLALFNRLLAPNVFYLEVKGSALAADNVAQGAPAGQTLRCKYSLISAKGLQEATSGRHFESYFWGRFAQPVEIVYAQEQQDLVLLEGILHNARTTFIRNIIPALPSQGSIDELWQWGLALSYGTELRAERSDRAQNLVAADTAFYRQVTEDFARANPSLISLQQQGELCHYRTRVGPAKRIVSRYGWRIRRAWGKLLSIVRVVKGLFTFEGGLDYIAWKLERHSGQHIEVPENVRRHPLIFCWFFFWKLFRRGVFK